LLFFGKNNIFPLLSHKQNITPQLLLNELVVNWNRPLTWSHSVGRRLASCSPVAITIVFYTPGDDFDPSSMAVYAALIRSS